jgi:hypothetical protein
VIDDVQRGGERPTECDAQLVVRPPGEEVALDGIHAAWIAVGKGVEGEGPGPRQRRHARHSREVIVVVEVEAAAERRKVEEQAKGDDQGGRRSADGRSLSCTR